MTLIVAMSILFYHQGKPVWQCENDSSQASVYFKTCVAEKLKKDPDRSWAVKQCRERLLVDSGLCKELKND